MAYKGPHGSVDVPGLGLFGVERGKPVEIEDAQAVPALRRQGWRRVKEDSDNNERGND